MRARVFVIAAVVVAAVVLAAVFAPKRAGPRIAAYAVTPDGREMYVLQKHNWTDFPKIRGFDPFFATRFAVRDPNGEWQLFFYWHEDDSGRIHEATRRSRVGRFPGRDGADQNNLWRDATL